MRERKKREKNRELRNERMTVEEIEMEPRELRE